MFKRETPLTKLQILKEIFWPAMGWMRAIKYARLRLIRLSDSSHKIAKGLATGISISFSPILGTHFIQASLIAFATRSNVLAALTGTFAGNPWTFPFMWWASIEFGSYLFTLMGLPASTALPEQMSFEVFWQLVTEEPMRIFMPWLLGGYLLAIITWPIWYFTAFHLVKGAKAAKRKAKVRRIHKVGLEITKAPE